MPIVPETEMTADRLTAEERAEWRAVYCDDARIIALLDALDAAERERDEARRDLHKMKVDDGRHLHMLAEERDGLRARLAEVERERDTARARVETLAEALRWYSKLEVWPRGIIGAPTDYGERARAALEAAGIDPSTAKEST